MSMSTLQPFHKLHLLHFKNTKSDNSLFDNPDRYRFMSPPGLKTLSAGALEAGTERDRFASRKSLGNLRV